MPGNARDLLDSDGSTRWNDFPLGNGLRRDRPACLFDELRCEGRRASSGFNSLGANRFHARMKAYLSVPRKHLFR